MRGGFQIGRMAEKVNPKGKYGEGRYIIIKPEDAKIKIFILYLLQLRGIFSHRFGLHLHATSGRVTSQNTMRHIVAGLYCAIVEKGNIVMVGQYPLLFNVVCALVLYYFLCYYVFFFVPTTYLLDSYNTAAV